MTTRSVSQNSTATHRPAPCSPRTLTQFLLAVSRKPPSTAHPKPKNISWACHWTGLKRPAGAGSTPEKISAQSMGRIAPAAQARMKKGRNPTSHKGLAEKVMADLRGEGGR